MPSTSRVPIFSAVALQGQTVTSAPLLTSSRRIFSFWPKSSSAIRFVTGPSGLTVYCSFVEGGLHRASIR